MVVKEGRFGRFLACSNYPDCKTTKAIPTGIKCPRDGCDGDVVEKKTRRGKTFWGCSKYPKCDFASWYKPVNQECPECKSPYLVEKDTKAAGPHLYCPECKHKILKEKPEEVTS